MLNFKSDLSLLKMVKFSFNNRSRYFVIAVAFFLIFYTGYVLIDFQSLTNNSTDAEQRGFRWRLCNEAHQAINDSKRNIFLVETTGRKDLSPRQLCAIESASMRNPDFNVIVYLKNTVTEPKTELSLLKNTYNITYKQLDVDKMFEFTILEDLIKSGEIQNSKYIVHMSDLVRLMLLWQYGGIYLDLDCIVLKSLAKYINFGVLENADVMATGFMGFAKKHPVMKIALTSFTKKYKADEFSANGPYLVTAAIRQFCQENSLEYLQVLDCGIKLYPRRAAYEIFYTERNKFFENDSESVNLSLERIKKSIVVHLWNHLTANAIAKMGDNTLLEILMKTNCPVVYEALQSKNIFYL